MTIDVANQLADTIVSVTAGRLGVSPAQIVCRGRGDTGPGTLARWAAVFVIHRHLVPPLTREQLAARVGVQPLSIVRCLKETARLVRNAEARITRGGLTWFEAVADVERLCGLKVLGMPRLEAASV